MIDSTRNTGSLGNEYACTVGMDYRRVSLLTNLRPGLIDVFVRGLILKLTGRRMLPLFNLRG